MLRFPCVLLVLLAPVMAHAQAPDPATPPGPPPATNDTDPDSDPADDPTEIATHTPLTTREAPGVVSVVQREEIERSGAVDLIDILHLVPGFSFGVDVEGVVAVAFRGLWAHEGKVLFLLDGMELNETLYAAMPLGLHLPASIIERVEVIRGPGSVVYGGYAELAVVNIVTRDHRTLSGPAASVTYGQMGRDFGMFGASASYAGTVSHSRGVSIATHIAYTDGIRSNRSYTDFAGMSYEMPANSRNGGLLVDVAAAWRGLKLRLVYDDYRLDTLDGVDARLDTVSHQRFESVLTEVRYEARLAPEVILTPRLTFKHQTPWQDLNPESPLFYDKSADRALAGLQLSWTPHRTIAILAGTEGMLDYARVNDLRTDLGFQTLFGSERSVTYGNLAGYGQLLFRNVVANVTLGARYEYHTRFGSSFVPRVGLTRVVGRFHFKLLFSQAFRAPSIENLNINPSLQPERTDVFEGELGLQLTGHLALSANAYWIRIRQPIVYLVDKETGKEGYFNEQRTGTAGAEAQLRARYAWGYINLGYSFYTVAEQNRVARFAVPGDDTVLLGQPAHKATLSASFNIWRDHVALGTTVVVMSPRHGYVGGDMNGNPIIGTEPTLGLLGATLAYRNLGVRGLDLSVGVQNILDQTYRVLQPYDGGHAPLPMGGRMVLVRLAYNPPPADG